MSEPPFLGFDRFQGDMEHGVLRTAELAGPAWYVALSRPKPAMSRPEQIESPYEVIIVLGAAIWPGGQPSPALMRRMAHAIQLLQAGQGHKLLVSGGLGRHPPAEARVMRRLAIAAGVTPDCIVEEDRAASTWESAMFCTRLLRQYGWTRVLVVTDRYHLPRALMTFWSWGLQVWGSAPSGSSASRRGWARCYVRLREVPACVWYLLLITKLKLQRWCGRDAV